MKAPFTSSILLNFAISTESFPGHLGIRAFDDNTRLEAYEQQHGVCPLCGAHFELSEMEADHITPWRDGGRTIPSNCQMLCRDCNRRKGAK